MSRRRNLWLFLGVPGLLILGYALNTLVAAGLFRPIEAHFAGRCAKIDLAGAEDISFDGRIGYAYISSVDRRAAWAGQDVRGDIYGYDPRNAAAPVNLTAKWPGPFQPHGISLFIGRDNVLTVMAVNHAGGRHSIEIFDAQADGSLRHRRTVADPLITSPNDVAAIDRDSFYVSNDHGYVAGVMRTLEDYLRLPAGTVVHYDGAKARVVIENTIYANGVALSRDGAKLYLAQTTARTVTVFNRNAKTGDVKLEQIVPADTGVDNIELDEQGALWIGAHPKMLDFVAHSGDAKKLSPSQVIRLTPQANGAYTVEEIYLNDGAELSGSASAAVWHKKLLIGPVFAPYFLNCDLP